MPHLGKKPAKNNFPPSIVRKTISQAGSRQIDTLFLKVRRELTGQNHKKPTEKEIIQEMKRRLGL